MKVTAGVAVVGIMTSIPRAAAIVFIHAADEES